MFAFQHLASTIVRGGSRALSTASARGGSDFWSVGRAAYLFVLFSVLVSEKSILMLENENDNSVLLGEINSIVLFLFVLSSSTMKILGSGAGVHARTRLQV